jgi:hypothetical protein
MHEGRAEERGLFVYVAGCAIEWLERETGIEPATFSLGS